MTRPERPAWTRGQRRPASAGVGRRRGGPPASADCFRLGADEDGNAYIGTTGGDEYVTDTREALVSLITAIKNGAGDHLL